MIYCDKCGKQFATQTELIIHQNNIESDSDFLLQEVLDWYNYNGGLTHSSERAEELKKLLQNFKKD